MNIFIKLRSIRRRGTGKVEDNDKIQTANMGYSFFAGQPVPESTE
jgi:hypothetical protein